MRLKTGFRQEFLPIFERYRLRGSNSFESTYVLICVQFLHSRLMFGEIQNGPLQVIDIPNDTFTHRRDFVT